VAVTRRPCACKNLSGESLASGRDSANTRPFLNFSDIIPNTRPISNSAARFSVHTVILLVCEVRQGTIALAVNALIPVISVT